MRNETFYQILLFKKKNRLTGSFFSAFFAILTMLTCFFWKNNNSLEHWKILLRIFILSSVFKNFDVNFSTLLKAEKVRSWISFWREFFFLHKFHFLSLIWLYKLLLRWIVRPLILHIKARLKSPIKETTKYLISLNRIEKSSN